jgi:suppressor of fused
MGGDQQAPGWDAISAATSKLYGSQQPRHWSLGEKLPGDAGLYAISAFDAGDHWHFVTLGLTELWSKENDDPGVSGFGFEFTMRTRHDVGDEPPAWVLTLLDRLADLVFQGHDLRPGHTLDPGGPITGSASSTLRAVSFSMDPQLGTIATPHGRVEFVQVLGITGDQLAAIKADRAVLSLLQERDPLLITDPER